MLQAYIGVLWGQDRIGGWLEIGQARETRGRDGGEMQWCGDT